MFAKQAKRHFRISTGLFVTVLVFMFSHTVMAQVPATYFKQNCFSCHTIGGGRLAGPDLKNVSERQSRDWLVPWILDPEGILASGDPYAAKLQKEARGAKMTRSLGMTQNLANALLDLIAAESKLEKSQFEGIQLSDRALLPEDIEEGRALFTGAVALKNGGPACIGCHTVNSLGGLGGGRLGLNLTRAYARLNGRKALATWLVAPPSLTMSPIFAKHPIDGEEILPLVAFLKNETEADLPENVALLINFVLIGVAGAVVLLVIFDRIWNKRFRAVRRPLIDETYRLTRQR
ncbi:MAG: cytochrome c [Candidatus Latescibacteria bacterium]|jgi:mono/diheme cytochrome c family protein|nr:cytochrome c [Candidatus Latescibacterota bacterium]MBT5833178.1 cytochrome c [Candidatus Latescibacterota bacterium]